MKKSKFLIFSTLWSPCRSDFTTTFTTHLTHPNFFEGSRIFFAQKFFMKVVFRAQMIFSANIFCEKIFYGKIIFSHIFFPRKNFCFFENFLATKDLLVSSSKLQRRSTGIVKSNRETTVFSDVILTKLAVQEINHLFRLMRKNGRPRLIPFEKG